MKIEQCQGIVSYAKKHLTSISTNLWTKWQWKFPNLKYWGKDLPLKCVMQANSSKFLPRNYQDRWKSIQWSILDHAYPFREDFSPKKFSQNDGRKFFLYLLIGVQFFPTLKLSFQIDLWKAMSWKVIYSTNFCYASSAKISMVGMSFSLVSWSNMEGS